MAVQFEWINAHRWVRKYEDIQADFPADGQRITDTTTIFVDASSGSQVTIQITYDLPSVIEAGNANWYEFDTVAGNGTKEIKITEYGPTAINMISSAAGDVAWMTG